ncbi:MAG: Dam family site-specific DNA-(adenine-N6)-methyltransferase [Bacilli bacterium]|nr:Dam family site-specific DNA-(adenine-N6)-methyltransferase [Bacilli bacterium]
MKKNKNLLVQPFLKWAGGKRQLIPQMEKYLKNIKYTKYYEPFVGGGSILFYLQPTKAIVNDYNKDLIECYKCIKNNYDELIKELEKYENMNNEEDFYRIREYDRKEEYKKWTSIEKSARLIYLNRTCYNGLFRLNSSGQFNTPFGKYKNPNICNKPVLKALHDYFINNDIEFFQEDFEVCCKDVPKGSLIYFDPPYDQFEEQVNFVGYTENGFSKDDQKRLKRLCDNLINKGCTVVISNSATPFIKELYNDKSLYTVHTLMAKRNINSKAQKRGEIEEVLIIGKREE